ncbi:MAG: STAS domain-containing protein [Candidatus Sericytochromatia bacterium]|nr:STAS domain-containing protein [Candidatus Tanganyikabacteria bacterium]
MNSDFTLATRSADSVQIVTIAGHVDAHTAPRLEETIGALLDEGAFHVVLDLADLTYISSAGLGVLTGTLGTFRDRGGDLKLARTPDKVFRVLDLLGFTRLLELFDTPEEAVAAFQTVPSRV